MRNTLTRIADLEGRISRPVTRRVYAVFGGPIDDTPANFVRSNRLPLDERDLIIHRVLVAPSPAGPVAVCHQWGWIGSPPEGARA